MRRDSVQQEQQLREAAAYAHGRLERELEALADSLNVSRMEFTRRVAKLLLGEGQWSDHRMPNLPRGRNTMASSQRSIPVAALESVEQPHGGGAQHQWFIEASTGSSEAAPNKVRKKYEYKKKASPLTGRRQDWWYKLSEAERQAIIAKRKASHPGVLKKKSA